MKNNQLKYSWKMPTILWWIVFILWGGSFYIIKYFSPLLDNRWLVWDSFGAINALFSWLAFAWLIYTIFLQMKELELTRDELRKSSEAQQRSEKALAEQVLQMEKAAKINALSYLIQHQNVILSSINPGSFLSVMYDKDSEKEKLIEYMEEIKKLADIK